jgi:hypothetical protein
MSQFNAPAYDIERPSGQCAFTGHTFEPGEAYIVTLVEIDDPPKSDASEKKKKDKKKDEKKVSLVEVLGLKRLDVSLSEWEKQHRPERVFSHWKTTASEPNKKRKLFVDEVVLMNLFRRLADTDNDQRLAFRFVLGLILMRKKYIRYDRTEIRWKKESESRSIKQEWWIVTPKLDLSKGPLGKWNNDDPLSMFDPRLGEAEIRQVTDQLSEILEAEL